MHYDAGQRRRRRRIIKRRGLCSRLARRIKKNPVRLCLVLIVGTQLTLLLVLVMIRMPSSPPVGGIVKRNIRDAVRNAPREAVHSVQSALQSLRGNGINNHGRFTAQQSEPIPLHDWRCTLLEPKKSRKYFESGAPKNSGYIYLLGDRVFSASIGAKQHLIISGSDPAMFDVLMGGKVMRGAFEVRKSSGENVLVYSGDNSYTTGNNMEAPIWLVLYKSDDANVFVHLAVEEGSAGGDGRQLQALSMAACPKGLNPSDELLQESFRRLAQKLSQPERRPFFKTRRGKATSTSSTSADLVTLCTQMTVDRLPRLLAQVTNFAGPVSAVIYVGRYKSVEEEMQEVAAAWESSETMQKYTDIHLVIDAKKPWFISAETDEARGRDPYPINLLRQESIIRSETEWVFVVEGDIIPAPGAHELIRSNWEGMVREEKRLLATGANPSPPGVAFVVPLYNAPTKDPNALFGDAPLSERVPKTKDALVASVTRGSIGRMSDVYMSHSGLDYAGWENRRDSTFAPYEWRSGAEPYHISRKDQLPPFDPLYAGMTEDKTSQLQDMGHAGFIFALHPHLYAVNFGSDGIGESWIAASQKSYWRDSFVHFMHEVFFKDYKRRRIKSRA
jgi:hypothetical protein